MVDKNCPGQMREEHDSLGTVMVDANRLWGAQTQRSFENFQIGEERMPHEIVVAFAFLKKAAARTNFDKGLISEQQCALIGHVCDEIVAGQHDEEFPLKVWQTGSGTQSNMNVNEVIAHRVNQLAGEVIAHPNDTVNCSQSSNDTFPTALHIAAARAIVEQVIPALERLVSTFEELGQTQGDALKCGRTHLQDAVPILFGQEISGWRGLIENNIEQLRAAVPGISRLALGATAVGTGLNAPAGFDEAVARYISEQTRLDFVTEQNKFSALTGKDAIVFCHGALKASAANLMKIANDIRWLASGPRLGLGEISIPANEPGSSIMPGKVNPTQAEALTMVAVQVMGNDAAIGFAASQGNFELNVFMPVIAYNFLQSARLITDAVESFTEHCVVGIRANRERMQHNVETSLMLVTRLSPVIGYENAAKVAQRALAKNSTLREAAVELGYVDEKTFDEIVRPEEMV